MREVLAEHVLAKVLNWVPEDVAKERPLLQAMAALKYDEYQQFAPGIRFVESLALWLNQFKKEERRIAYDFVKSRLVFFSASEIAHLVTVTYPDYIRPLLITRAANTINEPDYYIRRIVNSTTYKILRRQCLFLGLSDGARIDTFRRATSADLSHEQILQTYEMSPEKCDGMLSELHKAMGGLCDLADGSDTDKFRMIFLLDDFSGSGISYLRKNEDNQQLSGKLVKFLGQLQSTVGLGKLVNTDDLYVGIVLYIATERAVNHLESLIKELFKDFPNISSKISVVHLLNDNVCLNPSIDADFLRLADIYYDSKIEDEHTKKGGSGLKRGFNNCALPLVLNHNTPNNSMFLLWADGDKLDVCGLFPRVSRHRSEI